MERKEGKFKFEGERNESKQRTLFFFFFFFFVVVVVVTFHFSKPLKFIRGLPKRKILPGKRAFHAGKKTLKVTLPPP